MGLCSPQRSNRTTLRWDHPKRGTIAVDEVASEALVRLPHPPDTTARLPQTLAEEV